MLYKNGKPPRKPLTVAGPMLGQRQTLKDSNIFRQARIEFGAVSWPGNIDLAPDAMYREIKRSGEWVLR